MKIASVEFHKLSLDNKSFGIQEEASKFYDYIIPEGMDIKAGDFCLVVIRNSNRCEIVKIIDIQDENMYSDASKEKLMPLASKVDFQFLEKHIEKVIRKERLERQIDDLYKKVSKLKILESMAKEDDSLAKLIDEYKSLN